MSNASNMITLRSSDGEVFEVEETAMVISQTIKNMIEDGCADNVIPLPNVTGPTLSKVIEYCRKHIGEDDKQGSKPDHIKAFDDEFVKCDTATLFDLVLASNYLNIKSLLDLTCQTIADMIHGYSPEEIRALFKIENDFTPEEEAEIRKQNQWAFE